MGGLGRILGAAEWSSKSTYVVIWRPPPTSTHPISRIAEVYVYIILVKERACNVSPITGPPNTYSDPDQVRISIFVVLSSSFRIELLIYFYPFCRSGSPRPTAFSNDQFLVHFKCFFTCSQHIVIGKRICTFIKNYVENNMY